MSTLASYLLGNPVVQWTITISLMLFAMGLGSRLSKLAERALLDFFITIELALSLLCAMSATLIYFLTAFVQSIDFFIYLISIMIGLLIGLEVPLVTRLNSYFEELRVNISSVMEKDYYGALLGGLLFAFVALPYLGLTYTPIALGAVNLAVAAVLFFQHRQQLHYRRSLSAGFAILPVLLISLAVFAKPIVLFGEQQNYRDKVIYEQQTPYQKIVLTKWKNDFWLYLNNSQQFSTYDEEKYHEPLVLPAMLASAARKNILILGGGDGLAVRETLKFNEVESITLVDIDPAVTKLGKSNPLFLKANEGVLEDSRVEIVNQDAFTFLANERRIFDVVIIDLPDPKSLGLSRLYSKQFYETIKKRLSPGGVVVTQATSPFFAQKAFLCILKTMGAAGLNAQAFHNHIPTMGEWGWVIGMNAGSFSTVDLKSRLLKLDFSGLETRFLNHEAMRGMLSFGKGMMEQIPDIEVNDEFNLTLFQYYTSGAWDYY